MIGYTLLVLIALLTVSVGSVVVGVAVWGWRQEKKKVQPAEADTAAQPEVSQNA